MDFDSPETIKTDVLVIGAGAAGLRASIEAREHDLDVVLLSEARAGYRNNTTISYASFAAVGTWDIPGDSTELHFQDTVKGGRFMNDRTLLATMTEGAARQFSDLEAFGVQFEERDGTVRFAPQGHRFIRHVDARANKGIHITVPLRRHAMKCGVRLVEGVLITRLLVYGNRISGVLGMDRKGRFHVLEAKSVILATGGGGHIYQRTNNAKGITGDGYALAFAAGAVLRDMEFVQFYPTSLGRHGSRIFLYERFVPKGATFKNALDEDIPQRHGLGAGDPLTRDILARLIMKEILEGRGIEGQVMLDFSGISGEDIRNEYARRWVDKTARQRGLLVAPTTHFFMGGVRINSKCETGIDGLYAAGEVCGGVQGANRLAGNALAETFVFGTIAGHEAASTVHLIKEQVHDPREVKREINKFKKRLSSDGTESADALVKSLKEVMWQQVGIIRNKAGLDVAMGMIKELQDRLQFVSISNGQDLYNVIKLSNMMTVSEMICGAALMRTESRGAHYRTDFPQEDDGNWLNTIEISNDRGNMAFKPVPVNK